jgi:hypothetical protein
MSWDCGGLAWPGGRVALLHLLLRERARDGERKAALAVGSTLFTAVNYLVLRAVTPVGLVQIVISLVVSAFSLALIVGVSQRVFIRAWAMPILGRWVYESSSGNWGVADLLLKGTELTYSVQLYETGDDALAAVRGERGFAAKCMATVSSAGVFYDAGTVELIYKIEQVDERYAPRSGRLTLRPLGAGAMKGYWKSDLRGADPATGVLNMYRPSHFPSHPKAT